MARNLLGDLATVYADCGVPSMDEKSYVNAVLDKGNFQHTIATATGAISSAVKFTEWLGLPAMMQTPAMFLATLKSCSGMGVLLTGHDGDTIVSHGSDYPEEIASGDNVSLPELCDRNLI